MTEEEAQFWDETLATYAAMVNDELMARWHAWQLDLQKPEMNEAIGALMARQVTLATQMAQAPPIWNAHLAPLVLRAMVDLYISFAWILEDPVDRSRRFVEYGLGQEKLFLEQLRGRIAAAGGDPNESPRVRSIQDWIDSQRYTFLLEVNVGQWAEDTRKMADQAGCADLHRYDYTQFSGSTHSMWQHIAKFNLEMCSNPLHRFHRVPTVPDLGMDPAYLVHAAEYVERTFGRFDAKLGVAVNVPSALNYLLGRLEHERGGSADNAEIEFEPENSVTGSSGGSP